MSGRAVTPVIAMPLPDASARRRISTELDINLMVEAGAGSGKTTELVNRMVALVETGLASVEEIAGVTFTRKAASELRQRFQTRIEARLRAARRSPEADAVVVERLAKALDEIDRAFMGTIHAFCARLLRERPLEVGLDPGFEELPVEERVSIRKRFWGAYLERLTRDSDPILEELAQSGLGPMGLFGLFDLLVENPDVDFPTPAAAPPPPSEVGAVRDELEAIVDLGWELMPEREPDRDWDSLQKKIRTLHFTRDVTGWEEPADFYDALSRLCKPGPHGHRIVQKRWKNGALAKQLCARVDAFAVGDTPARRLTHQWYAHRYALALRLAGNGAREFAAHRLRSGRLDFQDLLVLAARLLKSDPDVRRQLGKRYRRILVDEFQDTDPLQAEIVLLLASEPGDDSGAGAGATRGETGVPAAADWRTVVPRPGALFVVGDPKQSIYRFRRADIQLYGLVKSRFRDFGDVVELTTNFRSRPCIGDLVNEVFHGEDFFPTEATDEQAAFEALNTRPTETSGSGEGIFTYDIGSEESRQAAAAADDAGRLAGWIRRRVDHGERLPGDFLVLTRNKARLAIYARALEAHGLPVQVTGAGVGFEEEMRELQVILECMIDPTNPVKVVAALVGLFFGIDYDKLASHRLEGGDLDAMRPGRRGHPDVLGALARLHNWWKAATSEPADVFVTRLASRLGLLPYAAAGDLGTLRAGAVVYGLDAVRAAALAGDASLPGALGALEAALQLSEAEAPLEPGRSDVIRLMNLHQAKGLEATVVILADPSGSRERQPALHVTRSADGRATAYVRVSEAREGYGSDKVLALPPEWDGKEEAERRFAAAEDVRLIYVAVTRAREELLVARWRDGPDTSPWGALHPWLDERATRLELEMHPPAPRAEVQLSVRDAHRAAEEAAASLADAGKPTYRHTSVTELAKTAVEAEASAAQPTDGSAGGFRGFSWGSAVHGALAAAASAPDPEVLEATCRDLLVEHQRPLDDHGEPLELTELVQLVREVRASALWTRAMEADQMLAEVPFSAPGADLEAGAGESRPGPDSGVEPSPPQMDLFGVPDSEAVASTEPAPDEATPSPVHVLEGVIDLAFRESDGWVIADYKTDVGSDPDFPLREATYRRQVELYADAWSRLTGDEVKERVLFFTAQGRVESW